MHTKKLKRLTSLFLAVFMALGMFATNASISVMAGNVQTDAQNQSGSYSYNGDIAEALPYTLKDGVMEFQGEHVDEPYYLSENQLAALSELLEQERPEGAYGFEDYDLTSAETISIIVEFVSRPAKVEQAIDAAMGKKTPDAAALSAGVNLYETKAMVDRLAFKSSLNSIFSVSRTGRSMQYSIEREYYEALNGLAMTLPANKIEELANLDSVQAVYPDLKVSAYPYEDVAETFDMAGLFDTEEMIPEMNDTREFLGVNELHAQGKKGAGVLVGVIDSGVDYTHPDLKDAFLDYDPANPDNTDALIDGKYYGRNFVMDETVERRDNDPMESTFEEYVKANAATEGGIPFSIYGTYTTEHGTHVSGEIVGRGTNPEYSVLGIAPEANLVVYRALGPFGTGDASVMLSGIEQSVIDGCDVVNMSLGVNENTPYYITSMSVNYTILAHDIVFCVAAANSGPRQGSLGSPSTAALAITVGASSVGYEAVTITVEVDNFDLYKLFQDNTSSFVKSGNSFELTYSPLTKINDTSSNYVDYSFYILPSKDNPGEISTGIDADWTPAAVAAAKGKIVIVQRGNVYVDTMNKAIDAQAGGLLVLNQQVVNDQLMTDYTYESYIGQNKNYLPVFGINEADGNKLVALIRGGTTTFTFTHVEAADIVASFSSRGPVGVTYDIKPDVVSPGVAVYSSVPYFYHDRPGDVPSKSDSHDASSYDYMRGTSMATPQTTGLVALMLSENMKANGGQKTMSATEVKARLMNSANNEGLKEGFGVYELGAGRVHIGKSIQAETYVTAENRYVITETRTDNGAGGYTSTYHAVTEQTASISFGSLKAGQGVEAQSLTNTATVHNLSNSPKTYELTYEFNRTGMAVVDPQDTTITVPASVTVPAKGTTSFDVTITLPADFMSYGSVEGYVYLTGNGESYRLPFALFTQYKGIDKTGQYLGYSVMNMPVISTSSDTRQMDYSSISGSMFSIVKEFDHILYYFSRPETPDEFFGTTGHLTATGSAPYDNYYYPNLLRGYYWEMKPGTDYTDRSFYNDYAYFEPGEYIMTSIALLGEDMATAEVVDSFTQRILVDNDAPTVEIIEKNSKMIRGRVYDAGLEQAIASEIYWPAYENEPVTDYSFATIFIAVGDEVYLTYANVEGAFYIDISQASAKAGDDVEIFVFDYFGPRKVPFEISENIPRQSEDFSPYMLSFSNANDAYSSPNMNIYRFKLGEDSSIDFDYADSILRLDAGDEIALSPRLTLIPSPSDLSWESSKPEVAVVDAAGVVTAIAPGDAVITASWKHVSADIDVIVSQAGETADVSAGVSIRAGDGVYFGTFAHTLSVFQYGYLMGNVPYVHEETKTPMLWNAMGEEQLGLGGTDGSLTLLNKHVVDFVPFSAGTISGLYGDSGVNRFLHTEFLKGFTSGENALMNDTDVVVPRNVIFTGEENTTDRVYGEKETVSSVKFYLPWSDGKNGGIYWSAGDAKIEANRIAAVLGDSFAEFKENPDFAVKGSGEDWRVSYLMRNPTLLHTLNGDSVYGGEVKYYNRTPSIMMATNYEARDLYYIEAGAYWGVRPITKVDPQSIVYAYEITKDGGIGKTKANKYYQEGEDSKNYKLTVLGKDNGLSIGSLSGNFENPELDIENRTLTIHGVTVPVTGAQYTVAYKIVNEFGILVKYGEKSASVVSAQGTIVADNLPTDIEDAELLTAYFWLQKNNDYNSNEAGVIQTVQFEYTSPEMAAPTVTDVTPAGDDAPIRGSVAVSFDGVLNVEGNVYIKKSSAPETAYVPLTYGTLATDTDANTSVFTVNYAQLAYDTEYTLKITGFARNSSPAEEVIHTFKTAPRGDIIAPVVVSTTPSGMSIDYSTTALVITFSEPMDPQRVGTVQVYGVYDGTVALSNGAWSQDNTVYTYTMSTLSESRTYQVDISGFADAAGNQMIPHSTLFVTKVDESGMAPIAVTGIEFNGGQKYDHEFTSGQFTISFSGEIGTIGEVTLSGGTLSDAPLNRGASIDYGYTGLTPGETYTITVKGFKGVNGVEMAEEYEKSFAITMYATGQGAFPTSLTLYPNSEAWFYINVPMGMPVSYIDVAISGGMDTQLNQIPLEELDFITIDTDRLNGSGSVKVTVGEHDFSPMCNVFISASYYGDIGNGVQPLGSAQVNLAIHPEPGKTLDFAIIADVSEGGIISVLNDIKKGTYGSRIDFYAIPDENYVLDSFEISPEVTVNTATGQYQHWIRMPNENVEIKANFKRTEYTIALSSNNDAYGSVAITPEKDTYAYHELVELVATPKDGYYLSRWEVENQAVEILENNQFRMPASNVKIVAVFEPYTYKVQAQTGKGGVVTEVSTGNSYKYAESGEVVSFIANTNPGYHFVEWRVISGNVTLENSNSSEISFAMPANNVTIAAVFELTITGIVLDRSSLELTIGNEATLTATVMPINAKAQTLTWSSSNPSVASVNENGVVKAIKAGNTVITVEIPGGFTASCDVKVVAIPIVSPGDPGGPGVNPPTDETEESDTMNLDAKIGNDGTATATVTAEDLQDALKAAIESGTLTFVVSNTEGAQAIKLIIEGFDSLTADINIAIQTEFAVIFLDATAKTAIINANTGAAEITITALNADALGLDNGTAAKIGNRPVYDISIVKGGTDVHDLSGGNAYISIPYTPEQNENVNATVVYYIDDAGNADILRGHYRNSTEMVEFAVKHLSIFAVGNNLVTFSDVPNTHGSKAAIDFIAAREITLGVGNGMFAPDLILTRAQFLVMMMRAYQIAPDTNSGNNFADAGDTYYTGYLAAAKRLGIAQGVGNNLFAPNKALTREEMFVLLYNTLQVLGEVPTEKADAKRLSDYPDNGQISDWAVEAVQVLVESKSIVGDGTNIFPKNTSVRYQMAQVLYNLLTAK